MIDSEKYDKLYAETFRNVYKDVTEEVRAEVTAWQDAGRAAYWDWERVSEARTPLEFAAALTRLSNSMDDLVTWLPGFDIETGILHDPDSDPE